MEEKKTSDNTPQVEVKKVKKRVTWDPCLPGKAEKPFIHLESDANAKTMV